MLHRISLAPCCCDQDTPTDPPGPTGTLGTAVFSVNASTSVAVPGGCDAIVGDRKDDQTMVLSLNLIFASTLRICTFLTNAEVRSVLIGNVTSAGGDPDFCEWFGSHIELQNGTPVMTADWVLRAVELGAFGGPPYKWEAGLSFDCVTDNAGGRNSQVMNFSSNPQQGLLDPSVPTPLTVDSIFWVPAGNPTPPGESVNEAFFDDGLSFLAVTGSN